MGTAKAIPPPLPAPPPALVAVNPTLPFLPSPTHPAAGCPCAADSQRLLLDVPYQGTKVAISAPPSPAPDLPARENAATRF